MSIILNNWVATTVFKRPHSYFDGYLSFASSIELLPHEAECMDSCLDMMEGALRTDGFGHPPLHAAVFFTANGDLSLSFQHSHYLGMHQSSIIFAVERWRKLCLDTTQIMVIMMEEFCHCFYLIWDEDFVKEKVTQIFGIYFPGISRSSLYKRFEDPAR